MQTKQIVFTASRVAELLDVPCLPPKENEVTVNLEYSAISSGTEKANFIGARNRIDIDENEEAVFPRTVGYSAAGVVTDVGSSICDIKIGDKVVVYWGKHQKSITIDRKCVIKIPDGVST